MPKENRVLDRLAMLDRTVCDRLDTLAPRLPGKMMELNLPAGEASLDDFLLTSRLALRRTPRVGDLEAFCDFLLRLKDRW